MNSNITIRVKLFAKLREEVGSGEFHLELPQGTGCGEVVRHLRNHFPHLEPLLESSLVAVNGVYTDSDVDVSNGDEVAVLPPVSGG